MKTELRVRYQETDQMGVVYHANYLVWFEVGRTSLIREMGYSYSDLENLGVMLPVVEANAQYRHPARYEDELVVVTEIKELGPSKIIFQYQIKRKTDDRLLATGFTKHVWVSKEMKRVQLRERCPDLYQQLMLYSKRRMNNP